MHHVSLSISTVPFRPPPDKCTLRKKRVLLELEGLEERIVPNVQVNTNSDAPNLPQNLITLRRAIGGGGGNVTITFAPGVGGQTISLTKALPAITGNITIANNTGSGIAVKGSGPAQNPYRVFTIQQGATCNIEDLTISNGYQNGVIGGGVFNSGTLTLTGDIVTNNTAANGYGGGIGNRGKLYLHHTEVNNNTTTINANGTAGYGGGIYNQAGMGGTVSITGGASATITNNQANRGGGIYSVGGQLTICGAAITYNTAGSNGGGVYISGGTVNMCATEIANNFGASGGGLYEANGTVKLTSCSVSKNTAKTGSGGGLYLSAEALSISGGTITGNQALNGNGGGIADFAGAFGNLTLKGGVAFKSNVVANSQTVKNGNGAVIAGAGGGLYVVKGSLVSFNGCSFTNDKAALGSGVAVENFPQNIVNWPSVTDNDDPPPNYVSVN